MAFVVPAEIGHAPYAQPLLAYLTQHFGFIQIVAIKEKLFPSLSEDAWLLYASDYSKKDLNSGLKFSVVDRFEYSSRPPNAGQTLHSSDREPWHGRLRPFLLPQHLRELYQLNERSDSTFRLGEVANIGIGYVTGANDFFHLRPSVANELGIPKSFLLPTVRTGRLLPSRAVTRSTVSRWLRRDEPSLLLRLKQSVDIPTSVRRYLDSNEGQVARMSYKCRSRKPWYSVPNVIIPDGFLSYMSSNKPSLVVNRAACTCTNSLHAIQIRSAESINDVQRLWDDDLVAFSSELEGHPLGGGVLKIEPSEAARILIPKSSTDPPETSVFREGIDILRSWRHCVQA